MVTQTLTGQNIEISVWLILQSFANKSWIFKRNMGNVYSNGIIKTSYDLLVPGTSRKQIFLINFS